MMYFVRYLSFATDQMFRMIDNTQQLSQLQQ